MIGHLSASPDDGRVLVAEGLTKRFPITKGFWRRNVGSVHAVDDVDLELQIGKTVAIVGESGSGKTTLGRMIVRALEPTSGQVMLRSGESWIDFTSLSGEALRKQRRNVHMVFQDPYSSLNPRMSVLNIVREPLVNSGIATGSEARDRVRQVIELVGLSEQHLRRYPHAFSGGQRQRIGIARALICNPKVIVADECVSALDVSIQAQILNLLMDLQEQLKLSYLFISHDLSVVEHVAHQVAVMYVGKIVELADTDDLFSAPRHPYTEALLSAAPVAEPKRERARIILPGEVASPSNRPSGCFFHPRCLYATQQCREEAPVWRSVSSSHSVACHRADELELKGMTPSVAGGAKLRA